MTDASQLPARWTAALGVAAALSWMVCLALTPVQSHRPYLVLDARFFAPLVLASALGARTLIGLLRSEYREPWVRGMAHGAWVVPVLSWIGLGVCLGLFHLPF